MKSLAWVLLALGASWTFSPGDAVTLRLKPKVGAQYVYGQTAESSTTMASQEGAPQKSRSRVTMTVLESSEDLVKMLATVDQVSPKTAGTPSQEGMKMTMSFSSLYQFKDIKVEGGGEAGEMIGKTFAAAQKMSPGFPEKPVQPGDSWTIDLDFEKMLDDMTNGVVKVKGDHVISLKITLDKLEPTLGRPAALVSMSGKGSFLMEGNGQEVQIAWELSGTAYYELATGMSLGGTSIQNLTMELPSGPAVLSTKSVTILKEIKAGTGN